MCHPQELSRKGYDICEQVKLHEEKIHESPEYPTLMYYLNLAEALQASREKPEVAWLAYKHCSSIFSSIMAAVKKGNLRGQYMASKS